MRFLKFSSILFLILLLFSLHNSYSYAENYSVLALRVDFPYEDPDEESTTGTGVFELTDYYTDQDVRGRYAHPWDIPPHNRSYFEYHLQALHNYWSTVSDGNVSISARVLPDGQDQAYTMSKAFYKYGNGRSTDETNAKLVELVREAVETCKEIEGGKIDFSDYDTIIVFHAGGARETYGNLNDIPSAYVTPLDFETYLYNPLVVDGTTIDKAIILPEYASNSGYAGLNGLMAQMFGFRLGLPSFSNNEDGLAAAGYWSLMDVGGMSYGYDTIGFVPTHPSAWSKIELGFIDPVVVTSDTTLDIAATHIAGTTPRAVKIPIATDEYLLLENRLRYSSPDSLPEGMVFSDSDSSGVLLSVDHYDAFIPGSGILIWRVNETIIEENRLTNTINDDSYRRGFDLLEADGRQDIGALFSFGDERAEYGAGHEDDTYKAGGVTVCSPSTNPSTDSMWGGASGITITVNSEPGEIMNVSVSFAGRVDGFPVFVGTQDYVTADDLDGDGTDEFMVSGKDTLCFVTNTGTRLHDRFISPHSQYAHPVPFLEHETNKKLILIVSGPYEVDQVVYSDDDIEPYSNTMIDSFYYTLYHDCHLAVYNNSFITNITRNVRNNITENNSLSFLPFNSHSLTPISISDSTHFNSLAIADDNIAALGKNESWVMYRGTVYDEELIPVSIDADTVTGPIYVDLDRDDSYEAVVTADQWVQVYDTEGNIDTASLTGNPVGPPVATDIDGDGYPEVIQCTEHHIFAFGANAAIVQGFPFSLPPGDASEKITSPPVAADVDNDGNVDIICATSTGRLLAFDPDGLLADGFPITTTGSVTSSPCVFQLSLAGDLGIAYLTTDGYLMAHDIGSILSDDTLAPWPMWKGGPGLAGALLNENLAQEPETDTEFEAFCYPNPITGDTATFRIIPKTATDIKITFYTVEGRKIFDAYLSETDVTPGLANEIHFSSGNLASGLYIARIETKQKSITYKVGVLK